MSKNVCNEEIFKSIFMDLSDNIRNFIYYKCGNVAQAEDLVQEAFSKLWQNCEKVSLSKAKSYLYTISNNMFLNEVAHRKIVLKFEQRHHTIQDKETPEFLLEKEEFRQRIEQAISSLPENQRLVFLLNRFDKKTYKEIAEDLNLSVKAVEKRMHNALKVLRKVHSKV